jgi:hypothetical protein
MTEKLGQFLACLIMAADEATEGGIIKPEFRAVLNEYSRQHQRLVLGWPDSRG